MQKPIFKNLENDIDSLIDFSESFIYTKEELQEMIMQLLNDTYKTINVLNEARFKNDLPKIEHDRQGSIVPYIKHYQSLYDKALENDDEDLVWRYGFACQILRRFQQDPSAALGGLKILLITSKVYGQTPEYTQGLLSALERHQPEEHKKLKRSIATLDFGVELYKQLEGYQVAHNLIVKSAALRLFRFFNVVTKVQKTKLATKIDHLFASLGEDVTVNPKLAGNTRIIGEFNEFPLYDYSGNKKTLLHDFGLEEKLLEFLPSIADAMRQAGLTKEANALMVGKEAIQLSLSLDILKL